MLDFARQVGLYLSVTALLLTFTIGVGAAVMSPILRRLSTVHRLPATIAAGMGVVVLTPTWWAYSDRRMAPVALLFLIVAIAGLANWLRIVRAERESLARMAPALGRGAIVTVAAAAASILQYRRVFTSGYLPSSLTAFTNENNDLAIYVLQADNIRSIGFGELGRAADLAIGGWAKTDHTGAAALSALWSTDLRVPSWQASIPTIAACTAATVVMLVHLADLAGITRRMAMWLAAIWAVCAPFPASIQTDYFLGQMVSRTLLTALVLIAAIVLLKDHDRRVKIVLLLLISVLVAAGLLAYPAGHIAGLLVAGGLATCFSVFGGERHHLARRLRALAAVVGAAGLGALSTYPRWDIISTSVKVYSKDNISGFPIETLDVRTLLGVPTDRQAISVAAMVVVATLLVLTVAGLVVTVRRRDWSRLAIAASMVAVPALLYVIVVARGSTSSYQTWKTVGSVQPFAIVGLVAVASFAWETVDDRLHRASPIAAQPSLGRWVLAIPCAALLVWVVSGAQDHWKFTTSSRAYFRTRYIKPEVAGLGGSALVRAQRDLRIHLSPYFETMVAAVAANLYDVHWAAETYLGTPSPDGTCELTTTELAKGIKGSGPPIPVGQDLVLVPVPFCAPPPVAGS